MRGLLVALFVLALAYVALAAVHVVVGMLTLVVVGVVVIAVFLFSTRRQGSTVAIPRSRTGSVVIQQRGGSSIVGKILRGATVGVIVVALTVVSTLFKAILQGIFE